MAHGYHLEAQYTDGFVLNEDEHGDVSPFTGIHNIFNDILEHRAEASHGQLVRFSLIGGEKRFDIDWTTLPDNARPIYFRDMQSSMNVATGERITKSLKHTFGYQYNDPDGANHKHIEETE